MTTFDGLFKIILALLCCSAITEGAPLTFPLLTPECQSNLLVLADPGHPIPCSEELTNLFENTNLITLPEQRLLKDLAHKYQNVTTNSAPENTKFKRWIRCQRSFQQYTQTFLVACFSYTNSIATDEIASNSGDPRYIICRHRDQQGNGYDIIAYRGDLAEYQGYKNWKLDGLCVQLNPYEGRTEIVSWTRFSEGLAQGRFLMWSSGDILVDVQFIKPVDFLKFQTTKFDLGWVDLDK